MQYLYRVYPQYGRGFRANDRRLQCRDLAALRRCAGPAVEGPAMVQGTREMQMSRDWIEEDKYVHHARCAHHTPALMRRRRDVAAVGTLDTRGLKNSIVG